MAAAEAKAAATAARLASATLAVLVAATGRGVVMGVPKVEKVEKMARAELRVGVRRFLGAGSARAQPRRLQS